MQRENLSYVDIAEAYRNYLIEQKGFKDKSDNITNSYYLDLYGGTIKAQSIAGFPVNLETAATTYEQAQEIIKQLNELGVDDIVANYNDFNGAGIKGMITADVNYAGTLGGKNAYKTLAEYVGSINGKLFASAGITYMKDSGNGYSYTLNACKAITKAYATTNNWDIAFGIPNQVRLVTKTTLSPYYWPDLYNKISKSFTSEGITTISLDDATTLLYSDFSRENYSRADTMNKLVDGYKQFKDAGFTLLASGANAYALPYVDYLTDVPVTSSNFDLFDYDIPFSKAAEIGTNKVINNHSTVGIVVTTDGSFGELPRESYLEAEQKTVDELKAIGKPFVILLNTDKPSSSQTAALSAEMSDTYGASVIPVNVEQLRESDITYIFTELLMSFPVTSIYFGDTESGLRLSMMTMRSRAALYVMQSR